MIFNPIVVAAGGSSAHTLLQYIESNGTQYIDTGFIADSNTRVIADVQLIGQTQTSTALFGARDESGGSTENKYIFWSTSTGGAVRSDYFGNAPNAYLTYGILGQRVTIDKNKNICNVGSRTLTNTVATGQCLNNLFLFCVNDQPGTYPNYFASMRLYSCMIYDDGELIRDFIPVRKNDGYCVLYDNVTKQYYDNAGAGVFIAGPEA